MSTGRMPAVVLGDGLTALGVTRCLGRNDIPVLNVARGSVLLRRCRWYTPHREQYDARVERDPNRLKRLLSGALSEGGVLFPCSDAFVLTVASLTSEGSERFRSFVPDRDVVETLIDKRSLADAARRAGVPHPDTRVVESAEDLEHLDEKWFESALLKPTDSLRFFTEHGVKGRPVQGREQALREYEKYFAHGEVGALLQQYVPGPPSAHIFLDGYRSRDGGFAGLLVRRRERMYPPHTGNSSSMVTIPRASAEGAVASLSRLLASVDFHGIFSAEFKEDQTTGEARLIEVNVRPWWFVEFTARCGVDVCTTGYLDVTGTSFEGDPSYDVGRRCVHTYYDLHAGVNGIRKGELNVFEWLRSWIGSDRPIFARDDPAPALHAAVNRLARATKRRLEH